MGLLARRSRFAVMLGAGLAATTFPLRIDVVAAPQAPVEIAIAAAGSSAWRVTYRLSQPVPRLRFARNPGDSRPARWQAGDGFEFAHADGGEYLRRVDGAAFASASVVAPARYTQLPQDYAPFSPFTDGGLLIHSGQFHACAGTAECSEDAEYAFTLTVPPGVHAIVHGERRAGTVRFIDSGDGTNVYVGEGTPIESEHFIAMLDKGLPIEINAALEQLFPPLMDYFAERLGELAQKPALYASIDPHPMVGGGFGAQGGTLPGLVFMHLVGDRWATESAERTPDQLPFFFAHEAGHLFQRTARDLSGFRAEESWIHEGGADAFAVLTIREFGGVDPALVEGRIERAADDCAAGLEALDGRALNASGAANAFDNYYNCGLVMNLAIGDEIRAGSEGQKDLFDMWSLFMTRILAGAAWSQETFFRAAIDAGAPRAARWSRELATTPQANPAEIVGRLRRLGS